MSGNPNNITGHNGAQIICYKGTLTQAWFFVTTFIFCGHFLGVTLTIKCCWFIPPLVRGFPPEACTGGGHDYIGWKTKKRADVVRRWPWESVSCQGPVSSLHKVSAKASGKQEASCEMHNPDSKCCCFSIHINLLEKGVWGQNPSRHSFWYLPCCLKEPWISCERSATHCDCLLHLVPSTFLPLVLDW